ncbi:hypothetical protein [Henriciella marina]|uniref:hypothetical protein n=1 Tax=Henriciella marina TaxID=453851 RepID=UPI00037DDF14|nr:hypothetical protein [Henriciella marina]
MQDDEKKIEQGPGGAFNMIPGRPALTSAFVCLSRPMEEFEDLQRAIELAPMKASRRELPNEVSLDAYRANRGLDQV